MNCATRRSTYRASAVAANAEGRAVASVPPARVAESDQAPRWATGALRASGNFRPEQEARRT